MFDIDLWREIFQSINKNRLRSMLSGFTVAFAIMLFTILFGIANGLSNTFAEAFGDDATNSIFIQSGTTTTAHKGMQAGRRIQFDNEDFNYIKDDNGNKIEFITARVNKNVVASYKGEKNNYSLRAVNPDHQFIEKSELVSGRFINQRDLQESTKVIVIGRLVKEDLFKTEKVNTNTILKMFENDGFKVFDYINYSGNNLVITRNPFGFVNTKKMLNKGGISLRYDISNIFEHRIPTTCLSKQCEPLTYCSGKEATKFSCVVIPAGARIRCFPSASS